MAFILDESRAIHSMAFMKRKENHGVAFLAFRYLRGRGKRLISPNHYLTLAGITLGVIALLCVSSVMNGFRQDIGLRIAGTQSEIKISSGDGKPLVDYEEMAAQLRKKGFACSPVIRNELLIKYGSAALPTISFGIDPQYHASVSPALGPLKDAMPGIRQGILSGEVSEAALNNNGIILSTGLAISLGANLGDVVNIISPRMSIPTAFGMIPRVMGMRVIAISESAMPDYQMSYSYISLDNARFFSGHQGIDQLDLRTDDFVKSEKYARQLQGEYPLLKVEPWSRFDASLYSAIRFEKFLMFVIMLLMYVIASFNLTGNMLRSIAQKKRELGLLKSIGFSDLDLRQLFLRQSFILSSTGIILGLVVASLLLIIQANTGLIKLGAADANPITLPVKMMASDFIIVILVSYALTLLSVMLPLKRLKEVDPIALIRQTT